MGRLTVSPGGRCRAAVLHGGRLGEVSRNAASPMVPAHRALRRQRALTGCSPDQHTSSGSSRAGAI